MNPQNKELHFLTSSQWNTVKKNSDAEPQPTILAGLLNLKLNMCLFLYLCCSNASQGNGYAILLPANEMVTLFYRQPMKWLAILQQANEMVTLIYRQPMKWLRNYTDSQWNGCAILHPANEMVALSYSQPMKWLHYSTASQWKGWAFLPDHRPPCLSWWRRCAGRQYQSTEVHDRMT